MSEQHDPYLWLEDIDGADALGWVREHNARSAAVLEASPAFEPTRERLMQAMNAPDRIPGVFRRGAWFYNVWRDESHTRGLLRRTTLDEYRKPEPRWEPVLDLDRLAAEEGENWVLGGMVWQEPGYRRLLLKLSRGGADAGVYREFDVEARTFVAGGFELAEAKGGATWEDEDTLLVWTSADAQTSAGYASRVRRLKRGQVLADAPVVFEAQAGDMRVGARVDRTPGHERTAFSRQVDFFRSETFLAEGGTLRRLDKPDDAQVGFWRDWVIVMLRSPWTVGGQTWPGGSTLIGDAAAYLAGRRELQLLFAPSPTRSLGSFTMTATRLLMVVQENAACELVTWSLLGRRWVAETGAATELGTLGVGPLHDPFTPDDPLAESYFRSFSGPVTPEALSLCDADSGACEPLKALPARFDANGLVVEQRTATSRDGTAVSYLIVHRKGLVPDGSHPTLLYGYGGFQVAQRPHYSGMQGIGWLEQGGVYVVAHIRGGGEYGPAWHQAALRERRQNAFDDFIAVAEHLIATGVTSPRHLGIRGESNGGLLVSAVMVQRPELFNAVLCMVPLTDMRRYHRLLAGASWMAEYGNPDDEADWAFLSRYSPYQNVRAGVTYPPTFFVTSTRDDRVHPGHARKMAARMLELRQDVLYFENVEGGHGGAANTAQRARLEALSYAFLWQRLR